VNAQLHYINFLLHQLSNIGAILPIHLGSDRRREEKKLTYSRKSAPSSRLASPVLHDLDNAFSAAFMAPDSVPAAEEKCDVDQVPEGRTEGRFTGLDIRRGGESGVRSGHRYVRVG